MTFEKSEGNEGRTHLVEGTACARALRQDMLVMSEDKPGGPCGQGGVSEEESGRNRGQRGSGSPAASGPRGQCKGFDCSPE